MAAYALALCILYLMLAFSVRTALQLRRTGSSGFKGISGRTGSAEWTGEVLFVFAFGSGLAAPVLDLLGSRSLSPFSARFPSASWVSRCST